MIKTSIIIPIYNVEKYLQKCLDSVINQTLKDIEIICINDESPDNCDKILAEYSQKDSRIIVLNQKNSGQGSARNRGLEIAKGKYIQFLDSDDFYEPNCCEEMYNLMEKHSDIDVACFDTNIIYEAYEDKKAGDANYFKMHFKGKTKVKPTMAHQLVDVNCWNKIFRKTFIDENNLRFPEKLHYEDVGFFWFWIIRTNYIYFYHKKLTNYLRRKGSFLGEIYEKSSKTIFDAFKVNELIYEDLIKNNKWEEYKNVYLRAYLLKIRWLINCFKTEKWKDRKNLIDKCATFLAKFNVSERDIKLDDYEIDEFYNVVNKNYYIWKAYQTYETEYLLPQYENGVAICFCCDRNYVPYLSVAIQSIIENSSLEYNYDIIILYTGIYDFQKRFLLSMIQGQTNFSIRFFNMDAYTKNYELEKLYTRQDMSLAAYYRLFIGSIFEKYNKIVYLDCDLVVTRNIAELFGIDLGSYAIGACLDTNIANYMYVSETDKQYNSDFREYMRQNFNYYDSRKYFNSGVLLINISGFNNVSLVELLKLAQNNTKYYHDQNVLNVAYKDDYLELPPEWNTQAHIKYYPTYRKQLSSGIIHLYDSYDDIPAIIHYTYHPKVWNDPYKQWSNIWWKYARKSPFYEILLRDLMQNKTIMHTNSDNGNSILMHILTYKKYKLRYWRYKLLSKITFGKMRKRYKRKKKEMKRQLKEFRRMLKN